MNDALPVCGDQSGPEEPLRPRLLIFDVNQTLSDMGPLGARIADLGIPEHLVTTWFAGVLRDGFALTAAGATVPFAEVAAESLRVLFSMDAPNRGRSMRGRVRRTTRSTDVHGHQHDHRNVRAAK